jgi:SAM-dependent methyltransferase
MDDSYRTSHSSVGYGERYSRTYTSGYYYEQWVRLERPLLRSVLGRLAAAGSQRCLDFACGTGRILDVVEEFFPHVVGVDVSEDMLQHARAKSARRTLICQDITRVPLAEKFDVATAFRFFLNAEPALRESAMAAIAGALERGGALVANIHVNAQSPLGRYYRVRNAIPGIAPISTLSHAAFSTLLEAHGFEVAETHWYSYLPRTGWHMNFAARRLLEPVEAWSRKMQLPVRWAQSFLVVARKR